jgi:tetratricopeptide (TPR) repeat protein
MKKLFHKPFKIIVILLTVISCQSSLNDRSTKIKNEKEKKEINELLKSGKYPSVIQKCDTLIQLNNKDNYWCAEFINIKGNALFFQGNFRESLEAYNSSLLLREKTDSINKISDSYINIGMVYTEIENIDKAEYFLIKALKSKSQINDTLGLISTYINLGNLSFRKNNWKKAIELFKKAEDLNRIKTNELTKGSIYNNLGATYLEMGELDSAVNYFNRATKIAKKGNDPKGQAVAYNNLGGVYIRNGDFKRAALFFERAIRIYNSIGARAYTFNIYANLANVYIDQKQFKRAKIYLDSSLVGSNQFSMNATKREIYNSYIRLDTLQGNYKGAISYYEDYINLMTQQLQTDFEKQMDYTKINFDIELSRSENALLNERLASQAKKNSLFFFIILFLLTLVVSLWLYFAKRASENKLMEKQWLAEIETLKTNILLNTVLHPEVSKEETWSKAAIEKIWEVKLNESDWKILDTIKNDPMLNNQEIADSVTLSLEGVRSSLKKMYRLANLEKRSPNQKLNLIHNLLKALNQNATQN